MNYVKWWYWMVVYNDDYGVIRWLFIVYNNMKKRNQRIHDYQTMGKKILCGKFAECLRNNFAVGDEDNNLLLYNILTSKPISVLNQQINSNNVSSLTSLIFTRNDDQIMVGSSRGSINVWDLNTLKINYCLKGHTVEVSSLYADRKNENLIVSGSSDTILKMWDLRTKNSVQLIKNHKKRINAIETTDSKLLISGGEDSVLSFFDMKMMKSIYQYELQAPVLSLDSTQRYLAVGSMDRLARIYDLNNFNLLGCTKPETMPITSVIFHEQHFLFTAGTDNLKVWDVSKEILLNDNIQTTSKGILNMVVSDKIQQIAFSSGTLSYHQCFLSEVNFKGPYNYINPSIAVQKVEKIDEAIDKNNKIKRGNSINPMLHITNEKTKNLMAKRNDSITKQLSGVAQNINDALTNIKKASEEFSNRRNESLELKEMMGDEHNKFLKIMMVRSKSIQGILDYWMKGNIKILIQQLRTVDIYVVADVLGQILKPSKVSISAEFGLIIAQRAKEMIQSKHLSLIKVGLQYMLQVVSLFKDDMIKLKTFGSDKGVDLARQERLRRFDLLIQQYVQVYQSHRLKRLIEKKDESSKLSEQLLTEFIHIFKKVYGNEYEL